MEDPLQTLAEDSESVLWPLLKAAQESGSSADPSTARALVLKALSARPELVCGYDQIKAALQEALRKAPDGDKLSRTLDLYSYGTYSDYVAAPHNYLSLTDAQLYKLRMLTVLSLVQQACQQRLDYLTYEQVQNALQLDQASEAEDVLSACVGAGVLRGQLCQKTRRLILVAPIPSSSSSSSRAGPPFRSRDVPPERAAELLETVRLWRERVADAARSVAADRARAQQGLEQRQAQSSVQPGGGEAPSAVVAGGGWGTGGAFGDPNAAAAYATGSREDAGPSAGTASRRQKRSRGGLGGMNDPFGGSPGFQP